MALAFGGVMNIASFFRTGFEGFDSFGAWAVGVAINAYGRNVITAIGRAMTTDRAPAVACGAFTPERKPTPA